MTEIFQICYLFIIFCLLIFCPINVYKPKFISNNPSVDINIAYNILLNFNVLLLLSVLPISLSAYSKIFILFYFALFVYNYLLKIVFDYLAKDGRIIYITFRVVILRTILYQE